MNNRSLFKLNVHDFLKGAVSAVVASVIFALAGVAQQPDFNVLLINWNSVFNAAVGAFLGYLGKNLLSDSQGNVLGIGKKSE